MNMVQEVNKLSPRLQRKRDLRIEQILDNAMSLVVDEGLEALTVHRLADQLDLTPGALYRYFPSMAAVLIALETRVIETYRATFHASGGVCQRFVEEQELDPAVASLFNILALADLYRGFVHHRPAEHLLIARVLADPRQLIDDDTAAPGVGPMLQILSEVADRLSAAAAAKALQPGEGLERALILWSGLQGVLQLRKLERFAPDNLGFDQLSMEMMRVLLRGWGADESTLAAAERALADMDRDRPLIEIVEETLNETTTTKPQPETGLEDRSGKPSSGKP